MGIETRVARVERALAAAAGGAVLRDYAALSVAELRELRGLVAKARAGGGADLGRLAAAEVVRLAALQAKVRVNGDGAGEPAGSEQ